MDMIHLKFVGISPLLMHSDRLANPLDAATRKHKQLTTKRSKTDEDHEMIARSEWRGGMYWSEATGPYLPTANIRSAIVEGGKLRKLGKALQRGTLILEDKAALQYRGPRDSDALWDSGQFYDCRSVVISGKRIMRYRPLFLDWAATVAISYDAGVLDREQILQCAELAGSLIGLGDFRPNKGSSFGRFTVTEASV